MTPSLAPYLQQHDVAFERIHHPKAIPALELAAALHVTGYQVAKPVLLHADGSLWMAVVPAPLHVDEHLVAELLGVSDVQLAGEEEFRALFAPCEAGAQPPFGRLFGVPVVVDSSLAEHEFIYVRAGTHEDVLRLRYEDFERMEQPLVGTFARPPVQRRWGVHWESREGMRPPATPPDQFSARS